jgi:hypothetical protein
MIHRFAGTGNKERAEHGPVPLRGSRKEELEPDPPFAAD